MSSPRAVGEPAFSLLRRGKVCWELVCGVRVGVNTRASSEETIGVFHVDTIESKKDVVVRVSLG